VTAVNGAFADDHPKAAAAVTRAMLKGAKWVAANKTAAAKLSVEKAYLASSAELNAEAIRDINYNPGVAQARRDILQVAKEMKSADFLSPNTDPEELVKRAWLDLDGVTDEWIESVKVEKVPGGGDPPKMKTDDLAALFHDEVCCSFGCCGELGDVTQLMTGTWASVIPKFWAPDQQYEINILAQPGKHKREMDFCTPQGVIKIGVQ
jgi:NitT/TauT family transport system substrate-binding protein